MTKRFSVPLALGLSLIASHIQANDLLNLYQLALANDSQLGEVEAGRSAVREQEQQIGAALKPRINLSGNLTQNHIKSDGQDMDHYPSYGLNLNLTQALYHKDVLEQQDEIRAYISQADANYEAVRQTLIVRVSRAYFDLLAARDGFHLAQAEKRAIQQQLDQTQQRFDVGLSAITDVHEAQASYDLILAKEIAAEVEVENARESLVEIVNQEVKVSSSLSEEIPLETPEPQNIDAWVAMALKNNPALQAQQAETSALGVAVKRSDAADSPTLDFVAGYGLSDTSNANSGVERHSLTYGLNLSMPLYTGGYNRSKTRESQYRQQQSQQTLEQKRRETIRQVRSAYLGITAGISLVKAHLQARSSAITALKATQAGFDVGTRTIVDILNAQRELFRTESDLAQARYNYLMSTLTLKQAAGILEEGDLQQINRLLVSSTEEAKNVKH